MPFARGNDDKTIRSTCDLAVIKFHGTGTVAIEDQFVVIDDPCGSAETGRAGTVGSVRLNDVVLVGSAQDRRNLHEPGGRRIVMVHGDACLKKIGAFSCRNIHNFGMKRCLF